MPPAFLNQLEKVSRQGEGWKACCPAHEDRTPSLSIGEGRQGQVLLKCHAGCSFEAIVDSLGLTRDDLRGERKRPALPSPWERPFERTYDYTDHQGNVVFQVVRWHSPKTFRQRRPDPARPGEWINNIDGVRRTLYHWHRHKDANLIYLVEGEKDVETLEALGLAATTNPMGAGNWHPKDGDPDYGYADLLAGKTIIVIPDNDKAGEKHLAVVTASLRPVAQVYALRLPIDLPKGDVTDWVNAGGTREELDALTADLLRHPPQTDFTRARAREETPPEEPLQQPYRPLPDYDVPLMPPLPGFAALDGRLADGAAPWLEAYVAYSRRWSPRAASPFHQGIGLWILSTIAARRISVEIGSPIYPVLFLALVARSTLFAKTTTAKLGRDAILQAGCAHLLGADRSTPQALLRAMTGPVPDNYGKLPPEDQAQVRARIGNAGQRGWYYEEWGGMLHQMSRADSPMSEFHSLLRVLDDGYESYTSETIARGLEKITAPYLALLTNATPHDLAKYMTPGAAWWHDGFWPRFAFLTPGQDELPSTDLRPLGRSRLPADLIVHLHDWHRRLGVPTTTMEEILDERDKPTGLYRATVQHPVYPVLTLSQAVYAAYNAYNSALLRILTLGEVSGDFEACYGRFHDKALRVAMLLASVEGHTEITMPYWAYAQQVTEQWRLNLHRMVNIARDSAPASFLEQREERIESTLTRRGPMTARDLCRLLNLSASEIMQYLKSMLQAQRVMTYTEGRKTLYAIPEDAIHDDNKKETNNNRDVPF